MPEYMCPIDPHVHLRGTEYKEPFLQYAIDDAKSVGISGLMEMPNCTPHLTSYEILEQRRDYCNTIKASGLEHRSLVVTQHPMITSDLVQAEAMLKAIMAKGLASDKIYYSGSTNTGGVSDPEIQARIWQLKADLGYNKVSLGHFEDESKWHHDYIPTSPETHSMRQSEESEFVQVENQLRHAVNSKFSGIFYVCHASSPTTVELLWAEKHKGRSFGIVVEATWHHLFLHLGDYDTHSNRVKMNPPLRRKPAQEQLLLQCLQGKIDVIGSDHAPHPLSRKDDPIKPASGIPAIPFWPKGIELLQKAGINPVRLEHLTFHTANRIFSLGQSQGRISVRYNPQLWSKYGFNPFSTVDRSND